MAATAPTDRLLSRTEAAEYLGVAPQTLAAWAHHARYPLTFVKVGRLAKYRASDLEAFIASRTVNGGDSAEGEQS